MPSTKSHVVEPSMGPVCVQDVRQPAKTTFQFASSKLKRQVDTDEATQIAARPDFRVFERAAPQRAVVNFCRGHATGLQHFVPHL